MNLAQHVLYGVVVLAAGLFLMLVIAGVCLGIFVREPGRAATNSTDLQIYHALNQP